MTSHKRIATVWGLALGIALLTVLPARAQSDALSVSPDSVAADYWRAFQDRDFDRAAAMMHPEALAHFRDMMMEIESVSPETTQLMSEGLSSFEAATPEEAFAGFMRGMTALTPEMGDIFGSTRTEIIGHVAENDSTAHVVTRSRMSSAGVDLTQMQVISMRRHEDAWRVLLSGEIGNLAGALRSGLEMEDGTY